MSANSEEVCKTLTKKCLEEFIKEKKSDERAQAFFVEDCVHDLFVTFQEAECCVLKGKCFRSMSKSEKPHEMKIILEFSDSGSSIVFRRCSCKAGQGHCHHLSALAYAVVSSLKESDVASACTSKPQQWHVPRGAKINPQPWMQLNFSKPSVGKETRRDASLCLYDPTSAKRNDPECRKEMFKEFQEKFKKACPAAPVIHVKNDSSTSVKTNFGEHQKGSPLSYHLPSIDSIGADQTNIYSELPIQLPVLSDGWSEYVHGFQNLDLTFITLSLEDASKLESGTREQSGSAKWKLERAERITASQFGQVFKRKAAVTEKFLKELFEGKTIQTPAMKYGLTNEIRAAKAYLDSGNNTKLYKSGLVVNPAFCWLGASPDGVVYDPSMEENPFGLFEAKCPFCGAGKKIVDVIKENKQFYLKQTDHGIKLKENHNYYYQVQGLMGVTGMKWCDFCVWTVVDFFQQRILFDETLWNDVLSKLTNFYFENFY